MRLRRSNSAIITLADRG